VLEAFIKDWIINIIALVLFIVLIEMIIPNGKTRKYVNLVTGFILIIVIINPIIKQFKNGISLESYQLADSAELQKMEIKQNTGVYGEEQMKQITEVYRQKVIAQLEKSAEETEGVADAEADVIINEDYKSDKFGEIKRAYINITPSKNDQGVKEVGSISKVKVSVRDKVEIGNEQDNGSGSNASEADSAGIDSRIKNSIEEKVSKLFDLDEGNIVIGLK
jgi:stage III sporulation protein AF